MVDCFKKAVAKAAITVDGKEIVASFDYSADTQYQAMNIPEDAAIVRKVVEAAKRTGRTVSTAATGGGCDANIFNQRGFTVANLGTGMRDIHTVREWLDIKDMVATAEVTVELLKLHAGQ
jgi:tripeptide aminopeptidase